MSKHKHSRADQPSQKPAGADDVELYDPAVHGELPRAGEANAADDTADEAGEAQAMSASAVGDDAPQAESKACDAPPCDSPAPTLRLYDVEIQHCLLGVQRIGAADEAAAIAAYKQMGGILASDYQPVAREVQS